MEIGTPKIDVFIQDQSTKSLSLFLGNILDDVTVVTNLVKDVEVIDIETTGVVPVVGNFICLQEDGNITQVEITTVTPIAGNQYTAGISIPIDYPYTVAGGCTLLDVNFNKDGSVTEVEFMVAPKAGSKWDMTRMIISMVLSSSGDDGLFGNISPLTNGMYIRKEDGADSQNLYNAKENSDFAVEGFDIAYPIRSGGGGSNGMRSRISFNGQDKRGVVIRLDGDKNERFKCVVRDNLTGINKFRIKVQGHVVEE